MLKPVGTLTRLVTVDDWQCIYKIFFFFFSPEKHKKTKVLIQNNFCIVYPIADLKDDCNVLRNSQ